MIITIDVGNTHAVFGLWVHEQLKDTCRLSTSSRRTPHEWAFLIRSWLNSPWGEGGISTEEHHSSMIYSSVVPSVDHALEQAFRMLDFKEIRPFDLSMKLPITFDYPNPERLGKDRIVNAASGVFFHGEDLIIVDFGTAVTFCVLTSGIYRGGVIIPGVQAGLDFLASQTAQLPRLASKQDVSVLGRSTEESILSGAHFGWEGMISHILKQLKNEIIQKKMLQNEEDLRIVATGGLSHDTVPQDQAFDVIDANLTLRGLHKIFLMNR